MGPLEPPTLDQTSLFPGAGADLVLVTGVSGFVGSHLVEALAQRGHRLRLLVRASSRLHWLEGLVRAGRVELAYGDVRDKASVAGACVGVRSAFHFAGLVKARTAKEFQVANADGTRHLAEALAERGLPGGYFVYCSSLAAGGPGFAMEQTPLPIRTEADPSTPITPYGQSKLDGERALREVADAHGQYRTVVLRPPIVYGPRDEGLLPLFKLIRRGILPMPAQTAARFSLIYVSDLVDASVRVAEQGVRGTYYVDDGRAHTWQEIGDLAGSLMDVTPRRIVLREWMAQAVALGSEAFGVLSGQAPLLSRWKVREMREAHWVCSSEKARRTWGYDPLVSLEQGLEETLVWYRQNQWL